MEQGRTEKRILQDAQRYRMPIPDAIANAPELELGNELFFSAYLELSTCRTESLIPWTAIADYCRAFEFYDELADDLMHVIKSVDSEMTLYRAEKKETARKAASKHKTRE